MGNLPRPSGKELLDFLRKQGFEIVRIRGSHHFLQRGELRTTVPVHGQRTLKLGTLLGVLRDIHMSSREFIQLWR